MTRSSRNRLKRLVVLWHEGTICGPRFSRSAKKLAETRPQVDKKLKKCLTKIDRNHAPKDDCLWGTAGTW